MPRTHKKGHKEKCRKKKKENKQTIEDILFNDPQEEKKDVSPIPNKMSTIVGTMQFLEEAYEAYLKLDEPEQEEVRKKNQQALQQIVHKSKLTAKKTLRELYIDLMMHDENIRNANGVLDKYEKYPQLGRDKIIEHQQILRGLLKNKFFIHMLIRVHEQSGEIIVPEPTVLKTVLETNGDPDQLKEGIMQWVSPNKKEVFRSRIEKEWAKNRGDTEWIQNMMKACFEHGIVIGMRTMEDSQKLVNIAEAFSLFDRFFTTPSNASSTTH